MSLWATPAKGRVIYYQVELHLGGGSEFFYLQAGGGGGGGGGGRRSEINNP